MDSGQQIKENVSVLGKRFSREELELLAWFEGLETRTKCMSPSSFAPNPRKIHSGGTLPQGEEMAVFFPAQIHKINDFVCGLTLHVGR